MYEKGCASTLTFQPETNISTAQTGVKPPWRKARRKVGAGRRGVARGGRNEEKDAITKPLTGFGLPVYLYEDAGFALLELFVRRGEILN